MRNALKTMVGMAFLLAAGCSGHGGGDGGSNGSGSTTGAPMCTPAGSSCAQDGQCCSNVCGIEGTGLCCNTMCPSQPGQLCSVPSGCDDGGACIYPIKGTDCGTTCSGNMRTENTCDGAGGCTPGSTTVCPGNASCGATDCNPPSCNSDAGTGCAIGYYCSGVPGQATCVQSLSPGSPCSHNDECNSVGGEVCGNGNNDGGGLCCEHACPNDGTPECVAKGCTDAGACVYPAAATVCDTANEMCPKGSTLYAGTCDGMGDCIDGGVPCPNHYACGLEASGGCLDTCASNGNCASGYYCDIVPTSRTYQDCVSQIADGGCGFDYQCISGACGANDNCCLVSCITGGTCGATGCDGTTEECMYPDAGTSCGVLVSCNSATNIQSNPAICDGQGTCPKPGTTPCGQFICDSMTNACFTTCTDLSACIAGDFCDPTAASCCPSLAGVTLNVDGATGKDAACCGSAQAPCQTITYAMKLIDAAQAEGTTLSVKVHGGGGDYAPAEVYPIVLGWGVELIAEGVNFYDPNSIAAVNPVVSTAVFDIKKYSANDTAASASIFGSAANSAVIGVNSVSKQTGDNSAIQVEAKATLYLADATVDGNAGSASNAITVLPGGTLTLGEDALAATVGTVMIGTKQNLVDGWNGIVCGSPGAASTCTVNDVAQANSGSSVVILNQENADIDAEDGASISLMSFPVMGVAPAGGAGFGNCPTKIDASKAPMNPAAVLLRGSATVTIDDGMIQCISGQGFRLVSSPTGNPTLSLDTTTIQNTELGIYASAGSVTAANSTIDFNYNGVEQATDGTNVSSINIGDAGNTVICSSEKESIVNGQTTPGVSVLNTTSTTIVANGVAWDTPGPDLFYCTPELTAEDCTCEIMSCTDTPGADEMDAVYQSTGLINTAGNTGSMMAAAAGCK